MRPDDGVPGDRPRHPAAPAAMLIVLTIVVVMLLAVASM